ncbi:hypothetical protein I7I48_03014 [Histoplasma ohiense]|nr:hypothetical protein I7I48_03014 [Histoplasma ohiense (nom. inval.)]
MNVNTYNYTLLRRSAVRLTLGYSLYFFLPSWTCKILKIFVIAMKTRRCLQHFRFEICCHRSPTICR